MDKKENDDQKLTLSCEQCCALIAPSGGAGITSETDDYVYHFCGPDCYTKWKERKDCCANYKSNG